MISFEVIVIEAQGKTNLPMMSSDYGEAKDCVIKDVKVEKVRRNILWKKEMAKRHICNERRRCPCALFQRYPFHCARDCALPSIFPLYHNILCLALFYKSFFFMLVRHSLFCPLIYACFKVSFAQNSVLVTRVIPQQKEE